MGTSACHMVSSPDPSPVPGMSGVVDGGIVPGLWGYEAGQSGVGDIFGWFVRTAVPESCAQEARRLGRTLHEHLTRLGAAQAVGEHGLVALDWHSGNRSVLVDHELSGTVVGLTLATRPEDVYRALLEATAFGTRRIIEAFEEAGVPVTGITLAGGLLENTFLTQLYADVTRRPLSLIRSSRGPALGSAMHAAAPRARTGTFMRPRRRWAGSGPPCTSRIRPGRRRTTFSMASTACCTTISAGARTT